MAVVEISGVAYSYPGRGRDTQVPVLREISMKIGLGDCIGVVGSNGSGKSTLLKIIATLLRPTQGEVLVDGQPLPRSLKAYRAQVNYCAGAPQGFYPRLTAVENLRFFSGLKGRMLTRSGAHELLERVGLSPHADGRYATFSLGMRQRLHLAALLIEPSTYWIVDEPTNGLDSDGSSIAEKLLKPDPTRAKVVVSHDHAFLERICTRTVVLEQGALLV